MSNLTWSLEKRKLSDLKEWERNPRVLNKEGIARLTQSIQKFGCCEPLVVNTDNSICGGHGRKKVLESLGVKEVDCYFPSRELTQEEFAELNIRLNKNIAGEFNFEMLAADYDMGFLKEIGFDEMDFNFDVTQEAVEDEAPAVDDVESVAKLGDVWQLGRHRVMCGDCCIVDNVTSLLQSESVNMVLTDPPYGVDYSSKNDFLNSIDKGNRNQTPIDNDNIKDYRQFFSDFLSVIPCADYNTFYVFMLGMELHNLRLAFDDCQIKWGDYLVWVKNNHVLGRKDYNAKHEFCVYGWKGKHKFYGDFSTTVLEFDKPLKNDLHPTMKPTELLAKLIKDGSKKDDIVYDCYGMEISPRYVDVIIARWEKLTGNKAVLIN